MFNIQKCQQQKSFSSSDEAPSTCSVFLREGGLELFMQLLEVTEGEQSDNHVQVETKILGLLVRMSLLVSGRRGWTQLEFS